MARIEREAAEKVAKEKAEKEVAERAEQQAAEKATRAKGEREAAEKAKRARAERRAIQMAALVNIFSQAVTATKSALPKSIPVLRIIGILGIIAILFWGGSWIMPKIIEIIPTIPYIKPSQTSTLTTTKLVDDIPVSTTITKMLKPTATSTKIQTQAPTPLPTEMADDFDVEMVLVPEGEFTMGPDPVIVCGDFPYEGCKNAMGRKINRHQVFLDAFYIDKYEVSNALYQICVQVGGCKRPLYDYIVSDTKYYGEFLSMMTIPLFGQAGIWLIPTAHGVEGVYRLKPNGRRLRGARMVVFILREIVLMVHN